MTYDRLTIREGSPDDANLLLTWFDEAVQWLVARGQTGQWGSEPFSTQPRQVARVRARVDCWADAPRLVRWYVDQGFQPTETFEVDGWRGQALETRVATRR